MLCRLHTCGVDNIIMSSPNSIILGSSPHHSQRSSDSTPYSLRSSPRILERLERELLFLRSQVGGAALHPSSRVIMPPATTQVRLVHIQARISPGARKQARYQAVGDHYQLPVHDKLTATRQSLQPVGELFIL